MVDRVDINVEICEETFEKTKFCVGINVLSVIKSEEEGSDESLNSFEREKEKDVMLWRNNGDGVKEFWDSVVE